MKIDYKEFLTALFACMLVLSNVLSSKVLLILGVAVPGGVLCFATCCLIADVIGELYGKNESKKLIFYGLIIQEISYLMILIILELPAKDQVVAEAYNIVLRNSFWFVTASLVSYLISQIIDILIFHSLKNKMLSINKPYKWVWSKTSTLISQGVDSIVFTFLAFGIGLGMLWDNDAIVVLFQLILTQYLIKALIAVIDTPLFYFLTRRKKNK